MPKLLLETRRDAGPPVLTIRPPTVADAHALGLVHVASWRSAYAGLLPEEFLSGLDASARADRWRVILGSASAAHTLLADIGELVIGFVSVGPPLSQASPGTAWLYALYVDPAYWDSGVGHSLHEAGLELLRADGFDRVELWVLRGNERAIAFYQRHGWSRDGREQLDRSVPGVELDEIGFSRPL